MVMLVYQRVLPLKKTQTNQYKPHVWWAVSFAKMANLNHED